VIESDQPREWFFITLISVLGKNHFSRFGDQNFSV